MNILPIIDVFQITVMIGIILSFSISSYYNLRWVLKTQRKSYSWIKIGYSAISLIWALMYVYVLGKIIIGNPVDTNFFGVIVVRPTILLTGVFLAFGSRARYYSLLINGEEESCLKQHNSL